MGLTMNNIHHRALSREVSSHQYVSLSPPKSFTYLRKRLKLKTHNTTSYELFGCLRFEQCSPFLLVIYPGQQELIQTYFASQENFQRENLDTFE